jgi:tRNA(Ile)-lysidine synthetase-like protein
LTRAGDEPRGSVASQDPWELVDVAVTQMAENNDVMRSDRLKQVMLEMDPTFDEKALGFQKFNRFMQDAAARGMVSLKKLENGQFEIGPATPGARAEAEEEEQRGNGRARRSRRGGRGRGRERAHGESSLDLPAGRFVRSYDEARLVTTAQREPALGELPVPHGCHVRVWQAGDRMRPARLRGRSRKLSDLYTDAKVPRSSRSAARVIVRATDGAILWAEYIGIAHDSIVRPDELQKLSAIPD